MCHFIYAFLPTTADHAAISQIFTEHGLRCTLITAPDERIKQFMQDNECCFLTTAGMCDCDTALIRHREPYYSTMNTDGILDKQEVKLKRRGWSNHKIDNWKAQKVSAREKLEHSIEVKEAKELEGWHKLVSKTLQGNLTSYLGMLVFWDDKKTVMSGRVPSKLGESMEKLEQNRIYEIRL